MEYKKIEKDVIKVWRIRRLIFIGILAVLIVANLILTHLFYSFGYYITIGLIVLLAYKIIGIVVYPIIEYKQWKYRILNDAVEIVHGIFFIEKSIIPIVRIQYVEISQGPIEKSKNMQTIEIHLANSSFEIEGLCRENADDLEKLLKNKLNERMEANGEFVYKEECEVK